MSRDGRLYLSAGLLLNSLALLLLFLPVFAVIDRGVIRWEEHRLEEKFGAPYLEYQRRVRG